MGRIIAIDYGRKRTGIAVTDELQLIANGLTTVPTHELMAWLRTYIAREQVEGIVVGEPRQMNNEPSEALKYIIPFVNRLKKEFPGMKVEMADERFSSKMALQTMIDAGLKKKDRQRKELVDTISATIILQSYLEWRSINKKRENN
ncbi:MAG: Holliday junction resolvase RuvX [Bacteroidales bacterium]